MTGLQRSTPLLVSLLLLPAAVQVAFTQQKPVPYADPLERVNDSIDALTRKVWPSVVQIHVNSYGAREDAMPGEASVIGRQRSVGSGFVVDADGFIMTNAHVVANAQRVQVLLPPAQADGSLTTALSSRMNVVPARIVGLSSELDIALLQIADPFARELVDYVARERDRMQRG